MKSANETLSTGTCFWPRRAGSESGSTGSASSTSSVSSTAASCCAAVSLSFLSTIITFSFTAVFYFRCWNSFCRFIFVMELLFRPETVRLYVACLPQKKSNQELTTVKQLSSADGVGRRPGHFFGDDADGRVPVGRAPVGRGREPDDVRRARHRVQQTASRSAAPVATRSEPSSAQYAECRGFWPTISTAPQTRSRRRTGRRRARCVSSTCSCATKRRTSPSSTTSPASSKPKRRYC